MALFPLKYYNVAAIFPAHHTDILIAKKTYLAATNQYWGLGHFLTFIPNTRAYLARQTLSALLESTSHPTDKGYLSSALQTIKRLTPTVSFFEASIELIDPAAPLTRFDKFHPVFQGLGEEVFLYYLFLYFTLPFWFIVYNLAPLILITMGWYLGELSFPLLLTLLNPFFLTHCFIGTVNFFVFETCKFIAAIFASINLMLFAKMFIVLGLLVNTFFECVRWPFHALLSVTDSFISGSISAFYYFLKDKIAHLGHELIYLNPQQARALWLNQETDLSLLFESEQTDMQFLLQKLFSDANQSPAESDSDSEWEEEETIIDQKNNHHSSKTASASLLQPAGVPASLWFVCRAKNSAVREQILRLASPPPPSPSTLKN